MTKNVLRLNKVDTIKKYGKLKQVYCFKVKQEHNKKRLNVRARH